MSLIRLTRIFHVEMAHALKDDTSPMEGALQAIKKKNFQYLAVAVKNATFVTPIL